MVPIRKTALLGLFASFGVCGVFVSSLAYGQWTERVQVAHAAYAIPGAPSAIVHAPPGFDASQPLHLVVFLHGLLGCSEVLLGKGEIACRPGDAKLEGWDLASAFDRAGINALLVIPQLAFMKRDRRPGRFAENGSFRAFLAELLEALPAERLGGRRQLGDIKSVTLVAHSAGYFTAAAILRRGQLTPLVRSVVLLDALYDEMQAFLSWIISADRDARLVSLHLGKEAPADNSRRLIVRGRRALGASSVAELKDHPSLLDFQKAFLGRQLIVARVQGSHQKLPEIYLGSILRALPFPATNSQQ
jgi:pimeloyl-ACP methyl ester carboxylesterase